jgi:type II secretion system protein N
VKKILIPLIGIPILFWSIWMVFPEKTIQSIIESSITNKKVNLEIRGIQKGLFFNFRIDSLVLKGFGGDMATLKNIRARINPLGLAGLNLKLTIDGGVGPGDMSGYVRSSVNNMQAGFVFKNADISDIPLLKRAGIQGRGSVSGRFSLSGEKGHYEFVTRNSNFEPVYFSGIKVPLNFFHTITGSLDSKGNTMDVTSISLEGKDTYARRKCYKDNMMI